MMLKLSSDVSSCAKPASPSSSTTPKIPRARLMPPILSSRAFLVTHNENPSERPAVPRSGCPRSRGVPQVSPPLRDLGFHNPMLFRAAIGPSLRWFQAQHFDPILEPRIAPDSIKL